MASNMKMNNEMMEPQVVPAQSPAGRRARYKFVIEQVDYAKTELMEATSEREVDYMLEKLETLMTKEFSSDPVLDDGMKHFVADIVGTISAVKLHDYTRADLCEMLQHFLNLAEKKLSEEENACTAESRIEKPNPLQKIFLFLAKHAENPNQLQQFLLFVADHADEIEIDFD